MEDYFKKGYKYVLDALSANYGAQMSNFWIDNIKNEIYKMGKTMIAKAISKNSNADHTQGFIAEDWHAGTFNINSAINHSRGYAIVPDSNEFASADIQVGYKTMFGKFIAEKDYSLKYCKTASKSYREQATSAYSRYKESNSNLSEEEYYKLKGIDPEFAKYSMYYGQGKIIASDKLEKAKELLLHRINRETANGKTELVNQYKEVYDTLTDILSDNKGNKSIPLSREMSQKLAIAAKKGEISDELLNKCGIDIRKLVTPADIMDEAFRAGITAASISLIITIAPVIVNGVSMLVENGKIDLETFKEFGYKSLSATAKSFINGSVSSAIITACKIGKLGVHLMDVNPSVVSACVVLTVLTIENSINYALGRISKSELAFEMMKMSFTTGFSVAGGIALGAILPKAMAPFSYMLGSFIGSIIGGFLYQGTEKVLLSYCVESGCTFFGLVDQNYEVPIEVLEELDIDLIEPYDFDLEKFNYDKFEAETFSSKYFTYEKIGIRVLKRGFIEAYSIGYI